MDEGALVYFCATSMRSARVPQPVTSSREIPATEAFPVEGGPVVGETGMRRNDIMNQLNQLILYVSRTTPFRSGLDRHLIRAAMVFTFFAFSIQKWSQYTAEMLVPLISHSPVVFWLLPAFGVRRAGFFLATTETIFRSLTFLVYCSPALRS